MCTGLEGRGKSGALLLHLQREVPRAGQLRGGVGLGSLLLPSCVSLRSAVPPLRCFPFSVRGGILPPYGWQPLMQMDALVPLLC